MRNICKDIISKLDSKLLNLPCKLKFINKIVIKQQQLCKNNHNNKKVKKLGNRKLWI